MSFKTSMHALSADAKRWDDTSDKLATAAKAAGGMTISPAAFTFVGGDAHTAYESLRSYAEGYLREGSNETSGAAAALRKVRNTYEGSDERAKDRLHKKWQWH